MDTALVIVDANPAMAAIAERPLPTLLGSKLSDVFPELSYKYPVLQQKPIRDPQRRIGQRPLL
ncbi:MAG: PAS domain-containing protein [Chloroflexi bacterium]|nr:PAS domain-containing protein [Chloroflexota bacterium]